MSNDTSKKQPAALLETLMLQFLGGILPTPEAVEAAKAYANGFLRDGDPEQSAEAIKAAAMQAAIKKTAADNGEKPPDDMQEETKRLLDMAGDDEESAEHKKTMQTLEEGLQAVTEKSAEIIKESKTRQDLATAAIDAMGDGAALLSKVYSSAAAEGGAEKDTFIRNGLEGHPDTVAEAVNVCKDVLASAARSAAMIMGGSFAMGASILPNWKADKTGGAALKMLLFMLYDEDDITGSVLQSIPKTMEYMRQHAPEQAAELEACAREEVKKAFLPLLEYVNGLGREDAEPVEDEQAKRNQRQRDRRAAFEGLPVKRTKKTTTKVCAIDLASNNLLEDKFFNREYPADLELWTKKNGERVTARFNVIPDDTIADKLERLSSMDQVVLDSVNSIFKTDEKRNRIMTMQQVFEVMTGGEKRATKDRLKDIRERISRLTHTKIELHFPDEEAKKIGVRKDYTLEDNIIPGALITQNVNGEETTCLVLSRQMPLLWYAERKNQILRYDLGALDVGIADTTDNIILKNYLVSRVKSRMTPTIRYDTIYAKIGDMGKTPNSVRNKQRKIRDTAIKIMEQLVKQGEISAYKEIRNGRKIYSIEFKRAATKEA